MIQSRSDGKTKCQNQTKYTKNVCFSLQRKYLEQIEDLYCDFHITKIPLFDSEVRGIGRIHTLADKLCSNVEKTN